MARHVFFSFHYQADIFRVNQIRNLPEIVDESAAGFKDKSLWEESKSKGDAAVKKLIDAGLSGTSVTVVCIGSATAGRKYINYEIEQSIARGNGVLGLQIHHLKSIDGTTGLVGTTPTLLTKGGYPVYKYTSHADLKKCIDAAAKSAGK